MKILLLGDLNSIHLIKWVLALQTKAKEIAVFSLATIEHTHFDNIENITIKSVSLNNSIFRTGEGSIKKLSYLNALPQLKTFIQTFNPDILHAHYASSYGLLGALTKFNPFVISVWGSDIFDFPNKNFIFKQIVKYTLEQADLILSTSKVMAVETKKHTDKDVIVTPFGVDMDVFKKTTPVETNQEVINIGTVKALEPKYGIDTLIEAFAIADNRVQANLTLQIVGSGGLLEELMLLCTQLNIENKVHFLGKLDNSQIPGKLNEFQIYVALSKWDSESFGVAIVEAQSCEVPVIVSDKGGLPEVVSQDETGLIVPANDSESAAKAMIKLIENPALRSQMGKSGRLRVKKHFDWDKNVAHMHQIYKDLLASFKKAK